jgi:hypothetical protein
MIVKGKAAAANVKCAPVARTLHGMEPMSEPFDPAALAEAMAPLLGLELTPERRGSVLTHLRIAADMAAKLDAAPLDDDAEPAPVFAP